MRIRQLSASPAVRPVFWWLLGGAALALVFAKRKTITGTAQTVIEETRETVKDVIENLTGITDKYVIAKSLYKAIDSELPTLPRASKLMIMAQAITESGWNIGRAAKNANNWWNVTAGSSWGGEVWVDVNGDKSYTVENCRRLNRPMSYEDSKGRKYCKIDQTWRKYATINDAVKDYWALLSWTKYAAAKQALVAGDTETFVSELRKAGYYDAPLEDYRSLVFGILGSIDKYLK
jgi:hypothetical protein